MEAEASFWHPTQALEGLASQSRDWLRWDHGCAELAGEIAAHVVAHDQERALAYRRLASLLRAVDVSPSPEAVVMLVRGS